VNYEYAIDDYYGNKHSKKEKIDGETARGEYRTLLPDGRRQIVTYDSGPNGHLANVAYEGEATAAGAYAPAQEMYVAPAPSPVAAYAPAPAPVAEYAPAPAPVAEYAPAPAYEDVVRNEWIVYLVNCF